MAKPIKRPNNKGRIKKYVYMDKTTPIGETVRMANDCKYVRFETGWRKI